MDLRLLAAAAAYATYSMEGSQEPPERKADYVFKHKTAEKYPDKVVGITLMDEDEAGEFTGIYLRGENDKLWPARTVRRDIVDHHTSVCESWLLRKGIHQDKRSVK